MTFYDLSHPIEHGLVTNPDLPSAAITPFISFEDSKEMVHDEREFCADTVTLVGATATYIDAPRHFHRTGPDVASLTLDRLVGLPVTVIAAPTGTRREYLPTDFAGRDLADRAVLLATGWDRHWKTRRYAHDSPYLGAEAALYLVEEGVALVGIDAVLIDDNDDPDPRPRRDAHHILLDSGIPIIENLARVTALPRSPLSLTAVPAAVTGVGSFPVRAFARGD